MTLLEIVGLYVAINLLLLPVLMIRVGQVRQSEKVSIGDGQSPALLARIRAHANFTETTPFALIGLFALASLGATPLMLHIFGGGFTLGRILHAHGMAQDKAMGKGRPIGTLLALLSFLGMGLYLLYKVLLAS